MDNERLVRVEESSKQAHKRLDTVESKISNIYELATSVREIAIEMKEMRKDMSNIDSRVKSIEDKPGKRYDTIVGQIISIIIAAVLGFFLAKIGL